jgi:hypothetical protein
MVIVLRMYKLGIMIEPGSRVRTILERSDHRKEGGIECIPIVVYAYSIYVKAPHCLARVNA